MLEPGGVVCDVKKRKMIGDRRVVCVLALLLLTRQPGIHGKEPITRDTRRYALT
jgi:hypothetical protein